MIENHVVKPDVYIPETGIDYPDNPYDFIVPAKSIVRIKNIK